MGDHFEDFPEILDVVTTANLLHVTPKTIRRYIEKGDIPAIKIGKIYRIPKNWLLTRLKDQ